MKNNLVKLLNVSTYEDIDGFYILRREDTGQEVFDEVSLVKTLNMNLPIVSNSQLGSYTYLSKNSIPDGVNALVYRSKKIDGESELRSIHYAKLDKMFDDGIRSFVKRKVF